MARRELTHLLLLCLDDAYSPVAWSGTPFNLREALEKRIPRVTVVTHVKPKRTLLHGALRVALAGKPPRYPLYLTPPAQKEFARVANNAIRESRPDAVLSVSSHFLIALDKFQVPTFMLCDAPWMTYKQVYGLFEPMPLLGKRFAKLEANVAQRCTGVIFASEWAAKEAVRQYGVLPKKVHVQPFGANLTPSISGPELDAKIDRRPTDRLDLLFVGKDWFA